eukprot:2724-Pelagococcus_subviridis.AAC.2
MASIPHTQQVMDPIRTNASAATRTTRRVSSRFHRVTNARRADYDTSRAIAKSHALTVARAFSSTRNFCSPSTMSLLPQNIGDR